MTMEWGTILKAVWALDALGAAFAAYIYFGGPLP